MNNKHVKGSTSDYDKIISEMKSDYETVIRDQKNRILKLREDNAELAKKLSEYEKYSDEIANTLLDARFKASEIVSDAKKQADSMLKSAAEQKNNSDKAVKYYKCSLKELEQRSERILTFIQNELSRDAKPALSIVNQ